MKVHPSVTTDRVETAVRSQMFGLENPGFCNSCGEDADGCEPDAEKYQCESCGDNAVYGAQVFLFALAP